MAFQHHPDHRAVTLAPLAQHLFQHQRLAGRVLAAVGMAAIDHQAWIEAGAFKGVTGGQYLFFLVVGALMAAAQHQVRIGIARCLHQGRMAVIVQPQVGVAVGGGAHGVAGHGDAAVGTVLEAHRQRQAADHFPMDL